MRHVESGQVNLGVMKGRCLCQLTTSQVYSCSVHMLFFNRISYMNGASRLCCTKENEKLHFVSPVLHLVCFTMLVYCVRYCCMWGFQVGNLDRSLKGKTFVAVLQTEQFLRCKCISSS